MSTPSSRSSSSKNGSTDLVLIVFTDHVAAQVSSAHLMCAPSSPVPQDWLCLAARDAKGY
jgi:hypothetical protein